MKAFLGMGLLGSNFVKAMLKKGEQVNVWNRTLSKAEALEAEGAKAFRSPDEAVKDADIIHLTLKDDTTVDQVLQDAQKGFKPGAIIIDHTTITAKGAIQRTAEWKSRGFTYLHAPVFMGPQNAFEGSGFMLVSGDQAVIGKLEKQLAAMTGKLLNFGPAEGKAAAIKLTGNLFLLNVTAGLADALALAKAQGVKGEELLQLLAEWNPGGNAHTRLKKMTDEKFDDRSWELNMARKDAGLMLTAAKENGTELAVLPAIITLMDQWIEKGFGDYDWSIIGKSRS